jgi:chemotaxis protein methyltransferase CheR
MTQKNLQGREFLWTDSDFDKIQSLIYVKAGISLHDGKHAMVYSRLSRRLRETGHNSFKEYLAWLEESEGVEWQEFVNALTTNLTSFFRERHHFELFSEHLKSSARSRQWNVWCAAASTGEEPYSIAITALEALGGANGFSLVASDIDSKVLATAQKGVYKLDTLKGVTTSQLQRFFLRGTGTNSGLVRVQTDLRKLIDFMVVNLIHKNWPFNDVFDVVFCRNVMIYFDAETQRNVLQGIHKVMKPGGLLFVGHAENFSDSKDLFVLKGKTVYERR